MMRKLLVFMLLLVGMSPAVRAQIGFEFGVGHDTQIGEVKAACGCAFPDGSGTGLMTAISYEGPLFIGIRGGVKTGIQVKRTHGSVSVLESALLQGGEPGLFDTVAAVPMKRTLDVSLTYATVTTYLSYTIPGIGLFVQVGTAVSDLTSSTFTQKRELTSTSLTTNGHTYNDMRLPNGSSSQTIEDGSVQNANTLRVAAVFSMGYELELVPFGVGIAPMVTFDTPLTTVQTTSGSNWKISSLYGTIALKFGL